MTTFQKVIKYLAMAFAIFLAISIIGGILGTAGLFSGLFDESGVLENAKTYTVSGNITRLEVEISAADFTIKEADAFSVESNLKNLTVTEKDGVLMIKEKQRFGTTYNGAALILHIPTETAFEKANITTGAGRLTADTLSANTLELELGAGEVNITSLTASKNADIDGGAGKITIAGGTLHDLDLDMGVGELNLTAAILGNSDLDLGVGESNITLLGSSDDYRLDAEKGIGNITVNGQTVSNFKSSGNGENTIDISGGIGSVNVIFQED